MRLRTDELHFAGELAQVMMARFHDPQGGGFFFTADDHEQLIHRSKVFADDATPAGNAIAAFALQRSRQQDDRPMAAPSFRAGVRTRPPRPVGSALRTRGTLRA